MDGKWHQSMEAYKDTYTHGCKEKPNMHFTITQEYSAWFKNSVFYISKSPQQWWRTQQMKAAEHIIEQRGSKPERGMLKLNTITAATAYVKSSPEHDAELRGFLRSLRLSKQK